MNIALNDFFLCQTVILLLVVIQCEKEYHVGCLRDIGLCELQVSTEPCSKYFNDTCIFFLFFIFCYDILQQELPKDKWFCCDDCNRIYVALQNSASTGADIIPSSLSELIIRKHEERGLCTYGGMNDIQWRILSGKSRYPEHLPLLSRAAAIFRVSICGFYIMILEFFAVYVVDMFHLCSCFIGSIA